MSRHFVAAFQSRRRNSIREPLSLVFYSGEGVEEVSILSEKSLVYAVALRIFEKV